jgi:hypothetical protein
MKLSDYNQGNLSCCNHAAPTRGTTLQLLPALQIMREISWEIRKASFEIKKFTPRDEVSHQGIK